MKKNFPLHAPGKADARVVEGIKHDVRKYVQRERRKELPEGFEQWDFSCKVGADAASAVSTELSAVAGAIDAVVATAADFVYVEILAVAAHRAPRHASLAATPAPLTQTPVAAAPVPGADLPTHLL
jgi:hypothetical protein